MKSKMILRQIKFRNLKFQHRRTTTNSLAIHELFLIPFNLAVSSYKENDRGKSFIIILKGTSPPFPGKDAVLVQTVQRNH